MADNTRLVPRDSAPGIRGLRSLELLAQAWLAGYRTPSTREDYEIDLRQWLDYCNRHGVEPLQVHRAVIETWQSEMLNRGLAERTVARKITAVASFYRYCEEEGAVDRTPLLGVRRVTVERVSPRSALAEGQVYDIIQASRELGPDPFALLMILTANGLRIGETCALNVDDLDYESHVPYLHLRRRKGGKSGRAALGRVTEAAVRAVIDGRSSGPLLRNTAKNRMTRRNAQVIIDRCVPHARGVLPRVTPHTFRHTWTTMAARAGVADDQVQHDGGWSDGRMRSYYQHGNLMSAASHAVEASIHIAA